MRLAAGGYWGLVGPSLGCFIVEVWIVRELGREAGLPIEDYANIDIRKATLSHKTPLQVKSCTATLEAKRVVWTT